MGMLYTLLSPETSSMQRKPVSRCTTRGFNCFEFASLGPTAYILLLFLSFHEASAYSDYVQEVAQPRELPPKSSSEDTSAQCWVIDCEDIEVQMLLEETERSCNDHHIHIWCIPPPKKRETERAETYNIIHFQGVRERCWWDRVFLERHTQWKKRPVNFRYPLKTLVVFVSLNAIDRTAPHLI